MAAGSIVIDLLMRTGSFETDTGRAEKRLRAFKKEAVAAGKVIGAAFAAVTAATAALVRSAINTADATSKLAQASGVTTESLSALGFAAKLSGASQEELGSSLQRLSRTVAEAAQGTGRAGEAFKRLGVDFKNADGSIKASDVLLLKIAERFKTLPDGIEKTALAQDLFGRSGAKLIPLLNQGADGIKELTDEAAALGVVIGSDTAKQAELFNDTLTRLNAVRQGLVNGITRELLPTLNFLSGRLLESAKSSGALDQAARAAATGLRILLSGGAIIVGVLKTVGEALGGVAAILVSVFTGNFKRAFNIAQETVFDFGKNVRGTASTVASIWDETAGQIESKAPRLATQIALPIIEAEKKTSAAAKKIRDNALRTYEAVERQIASLVREVSTFGATSAQAQVFDLTIAGADPEQLQRAQALLDTLDRLRKQQDALSESTKRDTELREAGRMVFESTRTPAEQLAKQLDQLNTLLQAGAVDWDTYGRAVFAAQDAYEAAINAGKEAAQETNDVAKQLGLTFSSAFEDAIVGGKGLKDVIKGIEQDLLRLITRKLITEPIAASISGMFSGGGGGGGWAGIISSVIGAFAGGRERGGDVMSGRSYLLGENGPEVFTPRTAGTVTPSQATTGGSRSFTQNNSFYVQGQIDRRTQQQIATEAGRSVRIAELRNA